MTSGPPTPLGAVVLDTNVVSELMRPAPDVGVQHWVREVPPAAVSTTSVTLAEVMFGIARLPAGPRRALLLDAAAEVFEAFEAFAERVLPLDAAAADQYGDIVVERAQAGAPISGSDAQIAAICRCRREALATRNTDHLSHLDLNVIDPWVMTPG